MVKKAIGTYLLLVIILSGIVDFIWIMSGDVATQSGISYLLMFMPAISVLITKLMYFRNIPVSGIRKCKPVYIVAGIIIPFVYILGSYGVYWIVNPESFTGNLAGLGDVPAITMIIMVIVTIITAFGEEVGWRGFLLSQLAEAYGEKKAILINGLIWSVWHWPLIFAGLYMKGTPIWYQIPIITIHFVLMTIIMSILKFRSNSVWPAVMLHAFHNYFDQAICMNLTSDSKSMYFTGETGIITLVILIAVATVVIKKQGSDLDNKISSNNYTT